MASVYYEKNHNIVGSWYPTSFHGHFRNRPRTEYSIPFRQRAKPSPPQKFLDHCKQRSNTHPFSQHDNRHAHSDMGNLESYFGMASVAATEIQQYATNYRWRSGKGLGKRKSNNCHHYKNTHHLLKWSERSEPLVTTYRSQYLLTPTPSTNTCNDVEPLHIRSNTGTQRRQLRVRSTPPRSHTASLLAWNTTDEFLDVKPLIGSRTNRFADHISSQKMYTGRASFSSSVNPTVTHSSVVSETVTSLNTV